MNKDQVKGNIKQAAGETQEQFGKIVGSKSQQAKGHAREQAGKVQETVGDVKETVKDSTKR